MKQYRVNVLEKPQETPEVILLTKLWNHLTLHTLEVICQGEFPKGELIENGYDLTGVCSLVLVVLTQVFS